MSSSTQIATLRIRLKGFQEPSTNSEFEGYLEPGSYVVQEYKPSFTDANTDYALVVAPTLGAGDTWICTRWKEEHYADIINAPQMQPPDRLDFANEPMAISEDVLVGLLRSFHDFIYDLDEARYPFDLPGVRVPKAPPNFNNCCTFAEALLVRAWADVHAGRFSWTAERHRQMMIVSSDDFFSPVTAAVESGMASPAADSDAPPHPWTLVQGWRHQWRSGHTFIIVDHHTPTDRVLTLESNSSYQLNGVGCRMIGNLRDLAEGRPPADWWENSRLWTWGKMRTTYRFWRQASLKVTDRSWSRL